MSMSASGNSLCLLVHTALPVLNIHIQVGRIRFRPHHPSRHRGSSLLAVVRVKYLRIRIILRNWYYKCSRNFFLAEILV